MYLYIYDTCICIHMYLYICIYVYIYYIRAHTHTHTRTHARVDEYTYWYFQNTNVIIWRILMYFRRITHNTHMIFKILTIHSPQNTHAHFENTNEYTCIFSKYERMHMYIFKILTIHISRY